MTYTVNDYIDMIGDPHRTGAYARALQKMVTAESVVLDLGAGFGFFAVLAAKVGARRAYAIEVNDAIGLGPALARANGVADRVTFFHGDSRQVELPERANLLVEAVRGTLPLHAERIRLLCDARERLLTADARLVACRDHIWAAPTRHASSLQRSVETTGADTYGVDLRALRGNVPTTRAGVDRHPTNSCCPAPRLARWTCGASPIPTSKGRRTGHRQPLSPPMASPSGSMPNSARASDSRHDRARNRRSTAACTCRCDNRSRCQRAPTWGCDSGACR